MQTFPSAVRASATASNETTLGEVCWHDSSTGLSGECQIRSPKCTIGSHPTSTIVLPENIAAANHLTLTFGKRFTLLKAPYPTRIQGRLVREWLIDKPIEFSIGTCLFHVVPSACAFKSTSVVRADQLVAAANRLSGPIPSTPSSQSKSATELRKEKEAEEKEQARIREVSISDFEKTLSRFDSIEMSLDQLRTSLGQIQESVAKVPIDSPDVSASLAEEFQQLSQNLALQISTELRSQFESRLVERDGIWNETLREGVEVLESRLHGLALKVESLGEMQGNLEETAMSAELRQTTSMEERFASIESRLDAFTERFVESANTKAASVSDLRDEWKTEFENRFQELRIHRDEIYGALESVRNEMQQYGSVTQNNFEYLLEQLHSIPQQELPRREVDAEAHNFEVQADHFESSSFDSQPIASPVDEPQQEWYQNDQADDSIRQSTLAEDPQRVAPSRDFDFIHDSSQQEYRPFANPADADETYPDIQDSSVDASRQADDIPSDSFIRPNLDEYSDGYAESYNVAALDRVAERDEESPAEVFASRNTDEPLSQIDVEPLSQIDEQENQVADVDIDALAARLRRMLSNSSGRPDTQDLHSSQSDTYEPSRGEPRYQSQTDSYSSLHEVEPPALDDEPVHPSQSAFGKSSPLEESLSESQDAFARYGFNDEEEHSLKQESSSFESQPETSYQPPSIARNNTEPRESIYQTPSEKQPEAEEEDSIEVYMQKLLQRVKGGQDTSSAVAPAIQAESKMAPRSRSEFLNRGNREAPTIAPSEDTSPPKTSMMTADEFVPRQQVPEKKNELDALRELANSNARRAITKSDSKRMNTAILLKIAITAFALAAALTLFFFNGLQINPPFAGMVAAMIVAVLWGIDCLKHFRLLGDVKASESIEHDRSMAVQQKNSQEQWRPKAD